MTMERQQMEILIANRLNGLVNDDYLYKFSSIWPNNWFFKMIHRRNSSIITLSVDFVAGTMKQTKNGTITYNGVITG